MHANVGFGCVPPVLEQDFPEAFLTAVLQSTTAAAVPLHAPQEVRLPTVASQPLATLASQAAVPASQVEMLHVELPQVAVATPGRFSQTLPQEPQFSLSFVVLVSQPSALPPEQSAKPVAQEPVKLHANVGFG